jgi:hypothetical protein
MATSGKVMRCYRYSMFLAGSIYCTSTIAASVNSAVQVKCIVVSKRLYSGIYRRVTMFSCLG